MSDASGNALVNCDDLEIETNVLLEKFDNVRKLKAGDGTIELNPQLQALADENTKLKYQINILKRHADELRSEIEPLHCQQTILQQLESMFHRNVKYLYPEVELCERSVTRSTNKRFGDYQCNSAMSISKILRKQNQEVRSQLIAQKIVENFDKGEVVESLTVAGPGFINVTIRVDYISQLITQILTTGVQPPQVKKQRVVVDFSSPNVAKEMHVGHLRSTIIGESVCRLLEFVGHDVLRLNHIGDWGTQFGMLIAHLQEKFPNYLNESPPIKNLQEFYKESKLRFDSDEKFKENAYKCVVALQNYEPDIFKAWKLICDVSRKEIQIIYDRLGIEIIERGESFYNGRMKILVEELMSKGVLEQDEGRYIIFPPGISVPLTVIKSDGGFTYATSDLTAVKQRVEEEKADWIIYVVDAGQALHLESVFKVSRKLGLCKPDTRIDHVAFGVVLGEDKKKFKTRSGDTVKLAELLDEGLLRSLQKLKEKKRDEVLTPEELKVAQESVAYGCIKYSDLSHNRTNDYIFSFDRMLDDKGNTAVYLLYAVVRIRSIARTANVELTTLQEHASTTKIELKHPKELALATMITRFSECLLTILDDLLLHKLCEYLYELSASFSEFYDECYCIVKDKQSGEIKEVKMHRLLLCEATARVMTKGLHILGLKHVEKM